MIWLVVAALEPVVAAVAYVVHHIPGNFWFHFTQWWTQGRW